MKDKSVILLLIFGTKGVILLILESEVNIEQIL